MENFKRLEGLLKWDPNYLKIVKFSLKGGYSTPVRSYHSINFHIKYMLREFDKIKRETSNFSKEWNSLEMAIWFHDLVYGDEDQSARIAYYLLQNVNFLNSQLIYSIIIDTKYRVLSTTPEGKLLCDLDLAFLCSSDQYFYESELRIRREFKEVPFSLYKEKRKDKIKEIWDRGFIYQTSFFDKSLAEKRVRRLLSK